MLYLKVFSDNVAYMLIWYKTTFLFKLLEATVTSCSTLIHFSLVHSSIELCLVILQTNIGLLANVVTVRCLPIMHLSVEYAYNLHT